MLDAWRPRRSPAAPLRIGVLPGEGIGPEVIEAALGVLDALTSAGAPAFRVERGGEIGLVARRSRGTELSDEVASFCEEIFSAGGAVLCGPGGGRFVYDLRAKFDLYCKLVPIRPLPELADTGALRPPPPATDLLVVRENVGGAYFGEGHLGREGTRATDADYRFRYEAVQVDRVLSAALVLARRRRRRLCVVVKPAGIPSISELWIERASELAGAGDVALEFLEIDNACFQVVAEPARFDVIAAPNMFGDVLGDTAALLLASRGNSYSVNFGDGGKAVYQTAHGAAYDLAGRDCANPIGQIQSLAMLLRESFGLPACADAIERGIASVVSAGWRTADIAAPGSRRTGTRELGRRIADAAQTELESCRATG